MEIGTSFLSRIRCTALIEIQGPRTGFKIGVAYM